LRRGDLYRVTKGRGTTRDPRRSRVFIVVSRQLLIDSPFSTVICAPIYSAHHGLSTQVAVGPDEGLKHESSIHCDELVSVPKRSLTDYVGALSASKLRELKAALAEAVDVVDIP
jgi:mRNA interferase MazF